MPLTHARRTFNEAQVTTKLTSKSPNEKGAIAKLEKLMKRLQKDNADSVKTAACVSHISTPLHALKVASGDLVEALQALMAAEATGDKTAAKSANREVNKDKRKVDKSRDVKVCFQAQTQNSSSLRTRIVRWPIAALSLAG